MQTLRFTQFIPGLIWFGIILVLICMPSDKIPEPEGWWEWIKLIQFDKIVHMGIFAVLVILFIYPFARAPLPKKEKWSWFVWIGLGGIAWGMGTELIQKFFVPTRFFDLIDFTADSIGALAGLFLSRAFLLNRFPHADA